MLPPSVDPEELLAQRYGAGAEEEWHQVRRMLELRQGFGLIILLVPDGDAAALCYRALAKRLPGQRVLDWSMLGPENLYELPDRLLKLSIERNQRGVFVAGAVPQSHPDQPTWDKAWRFAVARLNERRDVLRAHIAGPLVICGAPWLGPLIREEAPDLWSGRTVVARIPPDESSIPASQPSFAQATAAKFDAVLRPAKDSIWRFVRPSVVIRPFSVYGDVLTPAVLREIAAGLDPDLALIKAAPLRADPSPAARERLATLLLRATYGFALNRNARETERLASEVWGLAQSLPQQRSLTCQSFALKAWAALLSRHPNEALDNARRAVAFDSDDPTPDADVGIGLRLGYNVFWLAASTLGRTKESDAAFKALHQRESSSTDRAKVAVETKRVAALGAYRKYDFATAARHLELALSLQEQEGASPQDRAHTLGMLARCRIDEKKLAEAEAYARRALLLCEAAPDTQEAKLAQGLILSLLSDVLFELHRFRECAEQAQRAIVLLEAGAAEWSTQYREQLKAPSCLMLIGSYQEAAQRLAKLMDDDATHDFSAERLVEVAGLLHSALLLSGPPEHAVTMLSEVEQRLTAAGAPEKLRAQIQHRLRTTQRVGWLMPILRPFSRVSGWLFRNGIYPNQRKK